MTGILVVNVNWLGDVIFSAPVFRALRDAQPDAHIACLAVPRVVEILRCIPEIDEVIPYDESGADKGVGAKLRLVRRIKRQGFDRAYFLSRSLSRAVLIRLAGIPQRFGYENKGRGRLLTGVTPPPTEQLHRSDYYLRVIEDAGVPVRDRTTRLQPPDESAEKVTRLLTAHGLSAGGTRIVVNPGGNWDLKRWPCLSFARLIDKLDELPGARIIITGAPDDRELAAEILSMARRPQAVTDLTGQLTLTELIAFLRHIDIFVSADSGPLHIAGSVGTTAVGIFGPTRPEWTGPRGSAEAHILQRDVGCNREPCYYLECPDNFCMRAVTVDDVFSRIRQIQSA
ncbi:MAG: lipopolysaccharide heptosyltransferase II [Candidatus Omnitrophica bacterium]|nr:lipopolysaccharide heptosyltransferase II [Candidatus Omnitrophota bacterium]